jgi:peroxiredoxin
MESDDTNLSQRVVGQPLPAVRLPSTTDEIVDLTLISAGRTVIYCYPRTSETGKPAPTDWDLIPGARGCTPQACTFRDHYKELKALGTSVFGLSTQSTVYQREMSTRLHLPFRVLSDEQLTFAGALCLPMFVVDRMQLIGRLTIIARGGAIEVVLYPVLQPQESANDVIAWLKAHPL